MTKSGNRCRGSFGWQVVSKNSTLGGRQVGRKAAGCCCLVGQSVPLVVGEECSGSFNCIALVLCGLLHCSFELGLVEER